MRDEGCIFGTDGIRDRVGEGLLEASQVFRVANATAAVLGMAERFPDDFPAARRATGARGILIGRDTRASGDALTGVFAEAFRRAGFQVVDVGVIPTPGLAFLARSRLEATLGIMISASHNPAEYNGIKFLAPTGAKISPRFEAAVSAAFRRDEAGPAAAPGRVDDDPTAVQAYVESLVGAVENPDVWRGRRVAVDAANGATHAVAPRVLAALGAEVFPLGVEPDGENINADCGALHPQGLARMVREVGAFAGFAFDGDGDRMIPVTSAGEVLDGDHILAIAGHYLQRKGRLPRRTIVATVMSNLGLAKAAERDGLELVRTPVGDRHVYAEMVRGRHALGGEQSGHIIFLDHARTGDGILAALRLVDSLEFDDWDLAVAARRMTRYPQVLLNYRVSRRLPLETLPQVQAAVEAVERRLGEDGRVVLRYSGTEPLARVMIEGPEAALIERWAKEIGAAIVAALGEA